ncbi:hypothetical protein CSC82_05005 [Rhodobacteraceae bacterium 4F10]|nr:hypothetical protein CSC82_05005 [Rhodobacteraceae bacterium 4F10]
MTNARGMGPLPALVEEMGGSFPLHRVFARAGLPLALIDNQDSQIPMQQMISLFTHASVELGDRLFGLRVGQSMTPGSYGLWTNYATEAPTLYEAIYRLHKTRGVHQNMGAMRVHTQNQHAIWTYEHPMMREADGRVHADHILPVMLSIVRLYLGSDWQPDWVQFFYPQDKNTRGLSETLNCECRYGGHGVAVAIPRDLLWKPRKMALGRPLTKTDVFAEANARDKNAGIESLEGVASMRLLDGQTDISGMAEIVGCSTRSLQRELEGMGLTYRKLLDRVRYKKSSSLLRETELSITEVAFQIGYSDPAHFSRAFKRWTGRSPQAYRR